MIEFRLDRRSGMPVYRQLVDQVRQALQLGILRPGDKLPTIGEVVGQLPINPNTVHRAYQELERQGLTEGRPGVGTFISAALPVVEARRRQALQRQLERWVAAARQAGFDDEGLGALFSEAVHKETKGES